MIYNNWQPSGNTKTNLNDSILRTRGARGMFINKEFVKNAILLRASRFVGTSIADSFTVNKRYKRPIYKDINMSSQFLRLMKFETISKRYEPALPTVL